MFSAKWFFDLERQLRIAGLDSDEKSFDEIKSNLQNPKKLSPDAFARAAIYVVLAGGFSQKTAKIIHEKIMRNLQSAKCGYDDLLKLFNNKNKINAIVKIWENRKQFRDEYYKQPSLVSRISFIESMPHIGKITANHLARNLGENIVKYDIWIQRLGIKFAGADIIRPLIDNGKLHPQIKGACDEMFAHLECETGLPRGYIDVVLWKACQNKMISMDACLH